MNVLIACDSFKDALDAPSVCRAIERGLKVADASVMTHIFPLADGGEGLSDILNYHLGLNRIQLSVSDPLFRTISAYYNVSADGSTAFIEMAQAAGLQLLTTEERNPLETTTWGVGEMMKDAIARGVAHIVLGIGGSATHDVGIGMASALGWQFLDSQGKNVLPIGKNLEKIVQVIPPQYNPCRAVSVDVMCDVKNPLTGKSGAAQVYARQKGANDSMINILEKGTQNMGFCAGQLNPQKAATDWEGAGAAGGLGFGAAFFLNASIKSGVDAIMDLTHFDKYAAWADVIITGEGRLDSQTAHGKLITGIVSRAQGKPVIALCGAVEMPNFNEVEKPLLKEMGLTAAFSIATKPCTLQEALANTANNLEKTAFNIGQLLFHF